MGHDGAIAVVDGRRLLWSLESEKDSYQRHLRLSPMTILEIAERLGAKPDIIAVGGWKKDPSLGNQNIAAGYNGAHVMTERVENFLGTDVRMFSSSHIRSHIMMGAGMAPPDDARQRAVLVWEGVDGTFYLLDRAWSVVAEFPVLAVPGRALRVRVRARRSALRGLARTCRASTTAAS